MTGVAASPPGSGFRIASWMATGPESGEAFLAVGALLDREVALDELLRTLVRRIAAALEADRGTLYLVDRAREELFTRAADLPELPEIRLALGQGVAGLVAATGQTVNVARSGEDRRFFEGIDARTGYRTESILAVPLRDAAGAVFGVVQLLNRAGGPFTRADEVRLGALAAEAAAALETTTLYRSLCRGPGEGTEALALAGRFNRILGESAPMRAAYHLTTRAAASEATVLLLGESGTGKELFARAVHVNSRRRDGPFVKVDCAALPPTLVENELFGHERGAFTGADRRTEGRIERAASGTLFLDEIGELPAAAQGKLLRVLQDREFERVGGTAPVRAEVRVVAATHRDLAAMVEAGTFRADLYYRLHVVEIRLPPLRDRGTEDLLRLARHFVAQAARRHGRPVPGIARSAMARLAAYPWPGNVRELENCLESAVVIAEGPDLGPGDLPLPTRLPGAPAAAGDPGATAAWGTTGAAPSAAPSSPADVLAAGAAEGLTLAEMERRYLDAVLAHTGGNKSEAARRLGIGRNTLARKLRRGS